MKKALKITGNVILWLFIVFCAITMILSLSSAASGEGVPSIFGRSLISIQSDSMKPTFKEGDLLIVRSLEGSTERMYLKEGDVITFRADLDGDGTAELNSHRIVAVNNQGHEDTDVVSYVTKGDNNETNPVNDANAVLYSDVVGVWTGTKLSGLGSVLDFLQSSTGFLLIIVLPLAAFFIYELYCVISAIVSMKQKKAGISAADEEEIKRKAVEEYLRQQAAAQAAGSAGEASENADAPERAENAESADGQAPAQTPSESDSDAE